MAETAPDVPNIDNEHQHSRASSGLPQKCYYVRSQGDPSRLRLAFGDALANAAFSRTHVNTKRKVLYEVLYPPCYKDMYMFARIWRKADTLPEYQVRVYESSSRYVKELVVVLRRKRRWCLGLDWSTRQEATEIASWYKAKVVAVVEKDIESKMEDVEQCEEYLYKCKRNDIYYFRTERGLARIAAERLRSDRGFQTSERLLASLRGYFDFLGRGTTDNEYVQHVGLNLGNLKRRFATFQTELWDLEEEAYMLDHRRCCAGTGKH